MRILFVSYKAFLVLLLLSPQLTAYWLPSAQTIRPEQYHFGSDIRVSTISVDAQVSSRTTGEMIDKLAHEDFVISENGVPQELYAWDHLPKPLRLLILIDSEPANSPDRIIGDRFRDFRSEAINRLQPDDQIAIMVLGTRPTLLQDYTPNKELLNSALDRVSSHKMSAGLPHEKRLGTGLDEAAKHIRETRDIATRSIIVLISTLSDKIANEGILPKALVTSLIESKSMFFCESKPGSITTSETSDYSLDHASIASLVGLTGGEFLRSDWKQFLDRVRLRYRIAYIARTKNREGELVRISVELKSRPGLVPGNMLLSYSRFASIPSAKRAGK